jgi:hypothetical protein
MKSSLKRRAHALKFMEGIKVGKLKWPLIGGEGMEE